MPEMVLTVNNTATTLNTGSVAFGSVDVLPQDAMVLYSDFLGSTAPFNTVTGTQTAQGDGIVSYSDSSPNALGTLVLGVNGLTFGQRAAVAATEAGAGLLQRRTKLGDAAFDITARILVGATNVQPHRCFFGIGITHKNYVDTVANDTKMLGDGVGFQCAGIGTWRAVVANDYALDETDTGVDSSDDWHLLRVMIDAAGTSAQWFIDGQLVKTATFSNGVSMSIGVEFRDKSQNGTPNASTVNIDFLRVVGVKDRS